MTSLSHTSCPFRSARQPGGGCACFSQQQGQGQVRERHPLFRQSKIGLLRSRPSHKASWRAHAIRPDLKIKCVYNVLSSHSAHQYNYSLEKDLPVALIQECQLAQWVSFLDRFNPLWMPGSAVHGSASSRVKGRSVEDAHAPFINCRKTALQASQQV